MGIPHATAPRAGMSGMSLVASRARPPSTRPVGSPGAARRGTALDRASGCCCFPSRRFSGPIIGSLLRRLSQVHTQLLASRTNREPPGPASAWRTSGTATATPAPASAARPRRAAVAIRPTHLLCSWLPGCSGPLTPAAPPRRWSRARPRETCDARAVRQRVGRAAQPRRAADECCWCGCPVEKRTEGRTGEERGRRSRRRRGGQRRAHDGRCLRARAGVPRSRPVPRPAASHTQSVARPATGTGAEAKGRREGGEGGRLANRLGATRPSHARLPLTRSASIPTHTPRWLFLRSCSPVGCEVRRVHVRSR